MAQKVPEFLRLLRAGGEKAAAAAEGGAGAYAPLLAQLRGMTPSAIDRELRAMQASVDGEQGCAWGRNKGMMGGARDGVGDGGVRDREGDHIILLPLISPAIGPGGL